MSLSNIQAQLGNILAAMPLKLQKVSTDFLDETDPPFEGAVASSESGQFYIADFNSNGDLFWKAIRDTISIGESSGSEAVISYDLPIGFTSSTLSFGKNLVGDLVSVFCQLESPVGVDFNFYVTGVANIRNSEFDFYISDEIRSSGFKIHILAKAYANPDSDGDGVFDNQDAFPFDATETTDTDGDGVGDNSDVFPNDPGESIDTDGDGIGDNSDPDLDGDGIPNEMDADYSPSYNSSFSGVTFVSQDTGSGTNVLEVDDVSLFSLGDNLIIGEGTNSEEQVTVAGFGSLVFTTALKNYHPKGTSVRKVSELGLIELPSEVSYITDGVNVTSISLNGMIFNAKHSLFEGSTFAKSSDGVVDYPASVSAKGFDSEYETAGGSKLIFTFLRVNGVLEVSSFSADWSDVDGDGYGEHADDLPNDPTEHLDSDGDGVGDNSDVFPNDPTESIDSDGDGVGDNADQFPDDANISSNDALYTYVEGDGFYWPLYLGLTGVNPDASDFQTYVLNGKTYYMPNDASTGVDGEDYGQGDVRYPPDSLGLTASFYSDSIPVDTDGDRYPDISDAFPSDPNESADSDGDGVGDNTDAFPADPSESADSDGDGVGDNTDVFPYDANISSNDPLYTYVEGDGFYWPLYLSSQGLTDFHTHTLNGQTYYMPNSATNGVDGEDYGHGSAKYPPASLGLIASFYSDSIPVDTDGDRYPDISDAFPNDPTESADSDGDGVGDNTDAFPNDPTETVDSDSDGVGDNADDFPSDPSETTDSDSDGVGDNTDAFPNDPTETVDSDGDGVGDNSDVFPNDPTESADSDGDGTGDNADAFPNDPLYDTDTDGDGVPDEIDAFPEDPTESADSDSDGIGDNADAFPNDPRETVDADSDQTGDNIDDFPSDPTKSFADISMDGIAMELIMEGDGRAGFGEMAVELILEPGDLLIKTSKINSEFTFMETPVAYLNKFNVVSEPNIELIVTEESLQTELTRVGRRPVLEIIMEEST
tara:strand:+ start:8203 stop:11172 length:2970 start_codon:yes stop_codon:yes gene_type:complete